MWDDRLRKQIEALYIKDPAGFQPTALWKLFDMYKTVNQAITYDSDEINSMVLTHNQSLITYYHREMKLEIESIQAYDIALINSRYLNTTSTTIPGDKYFKMVYRYEDNPIKVSSDHVSIRLVCLPEDINQVVDVINDCYNNISICEKTVESWMKKEVFDTSLWIWLVNKRTNEPLALGIAEVDKTIREGALEWIQVLPKHQKKGYGVMLVTALQERMRHKVDFITVSGKLDDPDYDPKSLYKKCGFSGEDIWVIHRGN